MTEKKGALDALHPVLALPFVRDTTAEERASGCAPRLFWSVEPSGHYMKDCATGRHYARLALDYSARSGNSHVLTWAVFEMVSLGREVTGIEVGFLSVYEKAATASFRLLSKPNME